MDRDIEFSVTEDLALQDAVFKAGYRIRHVISPLTSVVTLPCRSLGEYVKQRHRWVRGGVGLGGRAVLFVASSIALWGGATIAVVFQQLEWLVVLIVLRFVADSILIGWSAIRLQRHSILPFIIPAMMLLISTELVLPILAMRKRVVWKQQTFQG